MDQIYNIYLFTDYSEIFNILSLNRPQLASFHIITLRWTNDQQNGG